jgi:C4-dicarboxylate transporter DctQ subunit
MAGRIFYLRLIDKVEEWANIIGVSCVVGIMFLVCADVTSRLLFNKSIFGVIEFSELLLVCVALFTFSYTQKQGGHIRMSLIVTRLHGKWFRLAETAALSVFLLFGLLATYAGIVRAIDAVIIGETVWGLTEFPTWPSKVLIPVGYSLLCLRIGIQIVQRLTVSGEHFELPRQKQES